MPSTSTGVVINEFDADQSTKYKLVGVLVHSGQASGGHYYSYILHRSVDRTGLRKLQPEEHDGEIAEEMKEEDDEEMEEEMKEEDEEMGGREGRGRNRADVGRGGD